MFNRKLKERVEKLERIVEGFPPREISWLFGTTYISLSPPGLRDKVDAISAKFGLEYEKTPDTKGAWIAVDKRKTKVRKG